MNRAQYDQILKAFFTCDAHAITDVLREFLLAMQAEETLPPVAHMAQNYETAQANPEIHLLPGNLKDARDTVFPYFWGTDSWASPLHLENVKGPANYASLIGALACLLKNPNLCTDTYSQRSNELEVKAVTALANLLFYHTEDPWGVFTMGGTISNLYGAKIGIEKVLPGAMRHGLQGARVAGLVSEAANSGKPLPANSPPTSTPTLPPRCGASSTNAKRPWTRPRTPGSVSRPTSAIPSTTSPCPLGRPCSSTRKPTRRSSIA